MRAFSASRTMNQLSKTKASAAPAVSQCDASALPSMPASCSDPDSLASTSSPRKNAGSARQAKVTSRAAPIPSNAEPVSRAAAAVKNRPRPSKYASRIRSPVNEIGVLEFVKGTSSTASAAVTKPTTGPARNTKVVVRLQQGWAHAAGEQRFDFGDDPREQWGQS